MCEINLHIFSDPEIKRTAGRYPGQPAAMRRVPVPDKDDYDKLITSSAVIKDPLQKMCPVGFLRLGPPALAMSSRQLSFMCASGSQVDSCNVKTSAWQAEIDEYAWHYEL